MCDYFSLAYIYIYIYIYFFSIFASHKSENFVHIPIMRGVTGDMRWEQQEETKYGVKWNAWACKYVQFILGNKVHEQLNIT